MAQNPLPITVELIPADRHTQSYLANEPWVKNQGSRLFMKCVWLPRTGERIYEYNVEDVTWADVDGVITPRLFLERT